MRSSIPLETVEDGAQGGGDVVDRVHVRHLKGGDQRGQPGANSRRRFHSMQIVHFFSGDRADLVFDRVRVGFQRALVQKADQTGPMPQRVADVLSQLEFLRDAGYLRFQPWLERGNDRG